MGTFVTATSTPTVFADGAKSTAPGVSLMHGWTNDNVLLAADANALHDALFDLRTAVRGRVYHVDNYGAVGDGNTNDTTAMQAAITAAEAAGGGVVELGPKSYLFTTLAVAGNKNVWIVGVGWGNGDATGGSKLLHSGTGNGITIGTSAEHRDAQAVLIGFQCVGNGTETSANGITITKVHNTVMMDVRVSSWGADAVELDEAYATTLCRVYCNNNGGSGFKANEQNAFTLLQRCRFLANTAKGVWFTNGDCDGTLIDNNDISGNAIGVQLDVNDSGAQPSAVKLTNNYFESQTGANVLVGTDAGSRVYYSLVFDDNHVGAGTVDAATNKCTFDKVANYSIAGNYFSNTLVEIGSNASGGHIPASNKFDGTSSISFASTSVIPRFDQSDSSLTRFGGALPKLQLGSAGWDIRHQLGVNYSGDVYELGNNLTSTSATQGNLNDTTASGFVLRMEGAQATIYGASPGSNPRTLTQIARWRAIGGGDDLVGVSDAMSGTPGSVTITTSGVTTNSVILFSRKTAGGTLGDVSVSAISNGASFTLTSTGSETSTFYWQIVRNP